ncbi:MAG TPA: RidA family protein, partial [Jatrophihabitans sp.]|nr:RidA family protein [Jatrophihabitans sp.]
MSLERINPAELARPSGFAHAVRASNTVRVHLAGQTALNPAGEIVGDGIVEQFEQALSNLLTALAAAGGQPAHLASVTIYAVDLADYR